jgi:hypothetical protein
MKEIRTPKLTLTISPHTHTIELSNGFQKELFRQTEFTHPQKAER